MVGRLTGGVSTLIRAQSGAYQGQGHVRRFAHDCGSSNGADSTIQFEQCIVATDRFPPMPKVFNIGDPRVMDSTAALFCPMCLEAAGHWRPSAWKLVKSTPLWAQRSPWLKPRKHSDELRPRLSQTARRSLEEGLRGHHVNTAVKELESDSAWDRGQVGKNAPAENLRSRAGRGWAAANTVGWVSKTKIEIGSKGLHSCG